MTAADPERCPNCTKLASVPVQELPSPVKSSAMPSVRWVPERAKSFHARYWIASIAIWSLYLLITIAWNAVDKGVWVDVGAGTDAAAERVKALIVSSFIVTLVTLVYFFPIQIAFYVRHPQTLPISLLTIFGGWTCIGWIAALVWAAMGVKPSWAVE